MSATKTRIAEHATVTKLADLLGTEPTNTVGIVTSVFALKEEVEGRSDGKRYLPAGHQDVYSDITYFARYLDTICSHANRPGSVDETLDEVLARVTAWREYVIQKYNPKEPKKEVSVRRVPPPLPEHTKSVAADAQPRSIDTIAASKEQETAREMRSETFILKKTYAVIADAVFEFFRPTRTPWYHRTDRLVAAGVASALVLGAGALLTRKYAHHQETVPTISAPDVPVYVPPPTQVPPDLPVITAEEGEGETPPPIVIVDTPKTPAVPLIDAVIDTVKPFLPKPVPPTPPKPKIEPKIRDRIPLDEAVSVGKCYLLDKGGSDVEKKYDAVFVFDKQFEKFEPGNRYFIIGKTVSRSATVVTGQLSEITCKEPGMATLDAIIAAKKAQPKPVQLSRVDNNGTCYLLGAKYAIEFVNPPKGFQPGTGYAISSYSPFVVQPKEIPGWEQQKKKEIPCEDLTASLPVKEYYGFGTCVTLTLANGKIAAGFIFGETLWENGFFKGVKYLVGTQGRNKLDYITHTPVAKNTPAEATSLCDYTFRKELPNVTEDSENLGRVHQVQPMRGN